MKNITFLALCIMVTIVGKIAAQEPVKVLSDYEKEGKLISVGMCDSSHTFLSRFAGKSYKEMVRIDPVSQNRYFVVRRNDGTEEFFIEQLGNKERIVEQKPTAMSWSMELMQESHNYFVYHFFKDDPSKQSDCSESPVDVKK